MKFVSLGCSIFCFAGDLQDEEQLLEWILSDSNLELPDQIEEVNAKMLAKKIESSPNLVVYFCKLIFFGTWY